MKRIKIRQIYHRLGVFLLTISALLMTNNALAIGSGDPAIGTELDYGLHWWDYVASTDGNVKAGASSHTNMRLNVTENFYDPDRPTIIYFHGWQVDAIKGGRQEDFVYRNYSLSNPDSETFNSLRGWKERGWNVGIYYWTNWADDSGSAKDSITGNGSSFTSDLFKIDVISAESKIWSSSAGTGMRFKYRGPVTDKPKTYSISNGSTVNDKIEYGGVATLKNLTFDGTAPGDAWLTSRMHNATKASQVKSALKFMVRTNEWGQAANLETERNLSTSCTDFVERMACRRGDTLSRQFCSGTGRDGDTHPNAWRDLWEPMVCELPSVGVMATVELSEILQQQRNTNVRFVGHSLGNQLATQTANRLWKLHKAGTFDNYAGLPKRLDLLDPYYSSDVKPWLVNHKFTGPSYFRRNSNHKSLSTHEKVYDYVLELRHMARNTRDHNGFTMGTFPVTYLNTSILSEWKPSGQPNNPLRDYAAYQRLDLAYLRSRNIVSKATNQHVAGKEWYFASMLLPEELSGGRPQLNPQFPAYGDAYDQYVSGSTGISERALGANSDDTEVVDRMRKDLAFVQSAGGPTFDITDDRFTVVDRRPNVRKALKAARIMNGEAEVHDGSETRRRNNEVLGVELDEDVNVEDLRRQQSRLVHDHNNELHITADNILDKIVINNVNITNKLTNTSSWKTLDIIKDIGLRAGKNLVAIEVSDAGGIAGLFFELITADKTQYADTTWKVSRTVKSSKWSSFDYDDSDWENATKTPHHGSPWKNLDSKVRSVDAGWIWSSDANNHDKVYFRGVINVPSVGWSVEVAHHGQTISNVAQARSQLNQALDNGTTKFYETEVLDFSTTEQGSKNEKYSKGIEQLFFNQVENGSDKFAIRAKTSITVADAGCYSFAINSDDGSNLKIAGKNITTFDGLHGVAAKEQVGSVYLSPGSYPVSVVFFNNAKGGALEVSASSGTKTAWNRADFDLLRGSQLFEGGDLNCSGAPSFDEGFFEAEHGETFGVGSDTGPVFLDAGIPSDTGEGGMIFSEKGNRLVWENAIQVASAGEYEVKIRYFTLNSYVPNEYNIYANKSGSLLHSANFTKTFPSSANSDEYDSPFGNSIVRFNLEKGTYDLGLVATSDSGGTFFIDSVRVKLIKPNPYIIKSQALIPERIDDGWVSCASESENCSVPFGKKAAVRYGADNSYVVKEGIDFFIKCSKASFGGIDPARNINKKCDYKIRTELGFAGIHIGEPQHIPSTATKHGVWTWGVTNKLIGTRWHTDTGGSGTHQHYLTGLSHKVRAGDVFTTALLINGTNTAKTVQLQVLVGSQWRRVHWGITAGVKFTPSKYMGALPKKGEWQRITASLSDLGIQPGQSVSGLAWTTHNGGRVIFDDSRFGQWTDVGSFEVYTGSLPSVRNLDDAFNALSSSLEPPVRVREINFARNQDSAGRFSADFAFPNMPASKKEFAIFARLDFEVKKAGNYVFGTQADDGLILNVAGKTVIRDDNIHGQEDRFGGVYLPVGRHELELVYFQGYGGAALELFVAPGTWSPDKKFDDYNKFKLVNAENAFR